jgi:Na+/glutamate symporter
MENKTKTIIRFGTIGIITLLVIGAIIFKVVEKNNIQQAGTQTQPENQTPTVDPKTQAQLNELDALRNQQGTVQSPTPEETTKQLNDLDAIRKQTNPKQTPPTQAEIDSQLQQLDALRKAGQ